ncbi:MAG: uncharacterized DUF497 family protein [Flavobacterium sp.]|jgi:uncharacterized DUF497 family protein
MRESYDEDLWVAIGWIQMLLGLVIYTERHDDIIRIISARKATQSEVRRYEQIFKKTRINKLLRSYMENQQNPC